MLRGIVAGQAVGEGLRGLEGGDMGWVDGWFEVWFLGGVGVTVVGIWVGGKLGGGDEWEDEDLEGGKRS